MYKNLLLMSLVPAVSVLAQNPAPQFQPQPGQPVPAAGFPAPTGAPQFQSQPGQPVPAAGLPAPTGAPQFQPQPGQPVPAARYPAPTGAPQFQPQPGQPGPAHYPQTAAPQFPGQHGGPAQHPQTAAPQFPGQHGGPGAHVQGDQDHDETVGTIIGIDTANQLVRIMTKTGPVLLKVTEDSELLLPGNSPEAILEIEPKDFERESKGKMVRIASRNGKIDHIEPVE